MPYSRYNFSVKLPVEIIQESISWSQSLSKIGETFFTLDNENYFAHLTIYSALFPEKNENSIFESLKNLEPDFNNLVWNYKKVQADEGFIGVEFEKTERIEILHKKLIKLLNPLREDIVREKYKPENVNLSKTSKKKLDLIYKYGNWNIFQNFLPHITLTKFVDPKSVELAKENLDWKMKSFATNGFSVFRMGYKHGVCVEKIN